MYGVTSQNVIRAKQMDISVSASWVCIIFSAIAFLNDYRSLHQYPSSCVRRCTNVKILLFTTYNRTSYLNSLWKVSAISISPVPEQVPCWIMTHHLHAFDILYSCRHVLFWDAFKEFVQLFFCAISIEGMLNWLQIVLVLTVDSREISRNSHDLPYLWWCLIVIPMFGAIPDIFFPS